jgi:hypothetical protein
MDLKVKRKVIESRNRAVVGIAYNINKMCFLPKLENINDFRVNNKLRIMSDLLQKNYISGKYLNFKVIEENNLTLIKNEEDKVFGVILEYRKKDDELDKGEYSYFTMYNSEQVEEQDKLEKILEKNEQEIYFSETGEIISLDDKKFNLKSEQINKFFEKEKLDKLDKILFVGLVRMYLGKDLDLNLRYTDDEKKELINISKTTPEMIQKSFQKADRLISKYLLNNIIEVI